MEAKEKGASQAGREREPRVAPGQSLKPAATDVFQRLHASHAARVEKLSMMQELAQQQEAAKLDELKRCTIRTCSSEEEAGQIYGRLYDEAQLRRKRREDLAREAEEKETWSSQWSSALSSRSQEVPRWEQLYNSAPLKEKRLGEERQRVQQQEEQWLAENCIHRSATDAQPDQIFSRLYRERFDREKRMEQMRAANAASRSQQLAEGSVHAGCSASEADLVERTRRLYEDGLQRMERLEVARRLHNQQFKAPRRSASAGPSRFEMLYSDASRRDEERKHLQECHERDELEMCRLQLVTTPRRLGGGASGAQARSSSARSHAEAHVMVSAHDAGSRIPRPSIPARPAEAKVAAPSAATADQSLRRDRSVSRGSQREVPETAKPAERAMADRKGSGTLSTTPRKAQAGTPRTTSPRGSVGGTSKTATMDLNWLPLKRMDEPNADLGAQSRRYACKDTTACKDTATSKDTITSNDTTTCEDTTTTREDTTQGATQERSHPHRRMAVRNGRELNCVCVDQM